MALVSTLLTVQTMLAVANLIILTRLVLRVQAHRRLDARIAAMLLLRRVRKSRTRREPGNPPRTSVDVTGGFRAPCR